MQKEARLVVDVISGGLILVFIALIISAVAAIKSIEYAAGHTLQADTLNHHYEVIERELWQEAFIVRVQGLSPLGSDWYSNFNEERIAADSVEASLASITSIGSAADRTVAQETYADHARYVDTLRTLFAQIDTGSPEAPATFKATTRIFQAMQARLDKRIGEQHDIASGYLARLAGTQSFVSRTILLIALVAGTLFSGAAVIIIRDRRAFETSRANELRRLTKASQTDTLTGLGNYRAYEDELQRALAAMERQGGVVTLALIDVDEFKAVNDIKGHIHGDYVLATLARLICGLRPADRGFRLGGDEFAVTLPDTNVTQALSVMERLRLDAVTSLNGATISVGIASAQGREVDAVSLRARADVALYSAKHDGRNRIATYSDTQSNQLVQIRAKTSKPALLQ